MKNLLNSQHRIKRILKHILNPLQEKIKGFEDKVDTDSQRKY